MTTAVACGPSFVLPSTPSTEKSREWGSLVVELFKKIMSKDFESLQDFQKDVGEIYQGMSQVLLRTYDGKNPLETHKETIEKATSELFNTIVTAKKAAAKDEEMLTQVVTSSVFTSLVQIDQRKQFDSDPKNYTFAHKTIIPFTLKEVPQLIEFSKVRDWFTSAFLFVVKKEDLKKQAELYEVVPSSVQDKIMPMRRKIGQFLLENFTKTDLAQLKQTLTNKKVAEAAKRYFELFDQAQDDSGNYGDPVCESVLLGLETMMQKLPDSRDERKA